MTEDGMKAVWQRIDAAQEINQRHGERLAVMENNVERLFRDHREIMLAQKDQSSKQDEFQKETRAVLGRISGELSKNAGKQDVWNKVLAVALALMPVVLTATIWVIDKIRG